MHRFLAVLAALLLSPLPTAGQTLAPPTGDVVLTIEGAIAEGNVPGGMEFDMAMLEALPAAEITTSTPWTDGTPVFRGILLQTLLDYVGAEGETLTATALNDFSADLPVREVRSYPVLLAYRMDGDYMRVRDKGPLWIVYPRDDYEMFMDEAHNAKWVWQVRRLRIE